MEPLGIAPGSRGAAVEGGVLFTWGKGAYRNGEKVRGEEYGPGGCVYDVNGDGQADLILHRLPGEMVWIAGPEFRLARVIDTEADFADCLGTTLFGRRGVLITHRGLQVRFYEAPGGAQETGRWAYREIYSFYTASYQAGLLLHDVDGDGYRDIFCGNYWIRSPERFELPWRLFAINTWNETPESAHTRLMVRGGRLLASQAAMREGRVSLFTAGRDARQLWVEEPVAGDLDHPTAMATGDAELLVSEGGRLWVYGAGSRKLLKEGIALHTLVVDGGEVIGVGPGGGVRLKRVR